MVMTSRRRFEYPKFASLATLRFKRIKCFARHWLVRDKLQDLAQMDNRFTVSSQPREKNSEIAVHCRLVLIHLQRFFVFVNCLFVSLHRSSPIFLVRETHSDC